MTRESLDRRVTFDNPEVLSRELLGERRALILSAHHANWEWLLLRLSTGFEVPLTAVYRQLDNERFERLALKIRQRFGCTMVRTRQLVQYLIEKRGSVRLLAMLADQSPSAKNEQQVWTEFFGHPTAFHAGPGWIAAKMGYVPFFAAVRRVRRGHYAVRLVPLVEAGARPEPQKILQAYVQALEQHVREYPGQYLWAYNRWKREKPLYA
jgi:KDO2-lipid IV(A) lauroyltransferase